MRAQTDDDTIIDITKLRTQLRRLNYPDTVDNKA
jgi:hypothetical protein